MLKKSKAYIQAWCKIIENDEAKFFITIFGAFIFMVVLSAFIFGRFELLESILLSFLFYLLMFVPGYAILTFRYFNRLNLTEKYCFSFGISSFLYAIAAMISALFFNEYQSEANIIFLFAANVVSLKIIFDNKGIGEITKEKITIFRLTAVFFAFIVFLQVFVILPFRLPEPLPDGPYVFKNTDNFNVKVQAITGNLPADNFVPYAFSQFLLKGISFKENRPMLPGQEVSNRTVLMGLNSAFFLSVFHPTDKIESGIIQKYEYLGTQWPDTGSLGNDKRAFSLFLDLGIVMNSLFLFAVFLFLRKYFGDKKVLGAIMIFMLFPYTVNQVIFTWPKFLMTYFLICALYLLLKSKHQYLAVFFLALAYHSHPSAIVYIVFLLAYWVVKNIEKMPVSIFVRKFSGMFAVFILVILPWIVWTKLIVRIPSDLISQNLVSSENTILYQIKVRLMNLRDLLIPWQGEAPNIKMKLTNEMLYHFPGAVGIYILIVYVFIIKKIRRYFWEITLLMVGPLVVLTLPWGKFMGALAILFAQPSVPLFFAFSMLILTRYKKWTVFLLTIQAMLCFYVLWFGMYDLTRQAQAFNMPMTFLFLMVSFQVVLFILGVKLVLETRNEEEFIEN